MSQVSKCSQLLCGVEWFIPFSYAGCVYPSLYPIQKSELSLCWHFVRKKSLPWYPSLKALRLPSCLPALKSPLDENVGLLHFPLASGTEPSGHVVVGVGGGDGSRGGHLPLTGAEPLLQRHLPFTGFEPSEHVVFGCSSVGHFPSTGFEPAGHSLGDDVLQDGSLGFLVQSMDGIVRGFEVQEGSLGFVLQSTGGEGGFGVGEQGGWEHSTTGGVPVVGDGVVVVVFPAFVYLLAVSPPLSL
jgi:hypothetical protein